jgi:hypothetical protein
VIAAAYHGSFEAFFTVDSSGRRRRKLAEESPSAPMLSLVSPSSGGQIG